MSHEMPAAQSLLGQLEEADRKLRKHRSVSADTTGSAQSADGLIDVTVGIYGEVRELVLDPRLLRRPDSSALANQLRDVINEAVRDAQQAAAGQLSALFPQGIGDPADLAFEPLHAEIRAARQGGLS